MNPHRLLRVTSLCLTAVLLNVVATQFRVTGPWILVAFVVALIFSLVAETEPGQLMDEGRIGVARPQDHWRQLTLWALLSTMIGALIAGVFVAIPWDGWNVSFRVGGMFGYKMATWHYYDIAATSLLVVLACLSALGPQSGIRLVIFGLFAATGETLIVTTFKFSDQLLVTFFTNALFIVGLSMLVYSRRVVKQSLTEAWGHLWQRRSGDARPNSGGAINGWGDQALAGKESALAPETSAEEHPAQRLHD